MPGKRWLDVVARDLAATGSRRDVLRLIGALALGMFVGRADGAEAAKRKSCSENKTRCGRKCVDTATSHKHCGGCRQKCTKGQTCSGEQCVNPGGTVSCNGTPCPDATFTCKGQVCVCPDDREPCVAPHRPGRAGTPQATCCRRIGSASMAAAPVRMGRWPAAARLASARSSTGSAKYGHRTPLSTCRDRARRA